MPFTKEIQDGVLIVTLDMPERSANVLNATLLEPFSTLAGEIAEDDAIKGMVLTSAKKDFIVGADIDVLFGMTSPEEIVQFTNDFKAIIRDLETGGKPVVAALNGSALGGGLELALGCHHRIALANPKAKFAFPEVKLGLLPGGGGTQRLPRMIGIQPALPLLLEGKELNVERALKAGIIDAVANTPEELLAQAKQYVLDNPGKKQPWDEKGFRIPGGDSKAPKNVQAWAIAPSVAQKKARGNYPAIINIMSCVFEGCLLDFDTGEKIESRYFANCVISPTAKSMISTFWYQMNALNQGESRPDGHERSKVSKVGILGAGMMGAGIAYVSAKAGIDVVLKDVSQEGAEKGKAYSEGILDKAVKRGRSTPEKRDEILARIKPTADVADLEGCDLIIEAVFEDEGLKAKVTKETEAVIPESAVYASNTSTLPITGLAKASLRPDQFIGLHFFSPVDKMPLVEIIKGEETSAETLARGFDYVQQIRKTPIVVNDSRGFYTSRVFGTYVGEGLALLADGQNPRRIESAGLEAGMPVGPLALNDEVSLSLSLHILDETIKAYEKDGKEYPGHPADPVVRKMVTELDREGKKSGKGFYDYPTDPKAKKKLWPELQQHFPQAEEELPLDEMVDRLLLAQANETVRCLEEGVLDSVIDANIGSIFGWGFAPWAGGTLQYLNQYGIEAAVDRLEEFQEKYGPRFEPAALLREYAEQGKTFTADCVPS